MVKTVSKSNDSSSESRPVPVKDLGGHYEDHKADPIDVSSARAVVPPTFKGMQDISTSSWIENLMNAGTVFTSPKGAFKLSPNGFHGSVQTIDEAIRRDAYVLRAVQRGKIRFLNDDEAAVRINELIDEESAHGTHLDRLKESLGANASENNGLYKIDLPDEAEPKGRSQTYEEIWESSASNAKPSL